MTYDFILLFNPLGHLPYQVPISLDMTCFIIIVREVISITLHKTAVAIIVYGILAHLCLARFLPYAHITIIFQAI